jgi:omega-6 fatty acid desaturase (delta-12 desaturase)
MWKTIGIDRFLLVQTPVSLIAAAAGVWLFYIQHQFEDTYWEPHESWDYFDAALQGCSYYDLPRVLHWFTGNIGYHHIHHLNSLIPNYKLEEAYKGVPAFQDARRLTLARSLRCAGLKLWDPEGRKLVGFRRLTSTAAMP